ncbi:MAG: hypothetical protein AAF914_06510, partial [Pseudomonadota bacterium]
RELSGWDAGAIAGFARRGGDGWQIAIQPPTRALRAALYCRAVLTRQSETYVTRIAVAVGKGQMPLKPVANPNAGHGPAFTASGRLLEELDRHVHLAHASGGAVSAAFRLADQIAQGWTRAQARALCHTLPPDSGPRAETAELLGITREAVNQALWAAGYRAIGDAIEMLEAAP